MLSHIDPQIGTFGVTRKLGTPENDVIYFLPWSTPYLLARACGLLPLPFAACYETPTRAVCADPVESVVTFRRIISDAVDLIQNRSQPDPPLVVGFSLGTVAATYVANLFRAPLLSICGAAHGEDMIWESPSAAAIRQAAEQRGYQRPHFYSALGPLNPAENLADLDRASLFLIADRDRIIPSEQSEVWQDILSSRQPRARVLRTRSGHLKAIIASRNLQRTWYRACRARAVHVPSAAADHTRDLTGSRATIGSMLKQ
jgi:pimeloyl-ACP methyl ester carboxylesterase